MDLLLCIVDANAAAKALASAASQSLHAVDDCSCVVECCTKVLPAALSALENAASTSEDAVFQAVECVQGCNSAMVQLQAAIEKLNVHDSEGVLGVLLEHPAAWLDAYRGFRGLTAQLLGVSCFVRAAAQRGRADDADEALEESVKALMATCSRAREAANLIGTELPAFAADAAAGGWSTARLHCMMGGGAAAAAVVGGASGAASPCCGCGEGAASAAPAAVLAAASAALQQQELKSQPAAHPHQQQRIGLLRRIGQVAACSSPLRRSGGGGTSPDRTIVVNAAGRLDEAACNLVARIQDLILYDSEVEHLEQDQAYLRQRVANLLDYCGGSGGGAVVVTSPSAAATTATAAALIQSEILLAAVDARLKALAEQSDSGDAVALVCAGGVGCGANGLRGGGGGAKAAARRLSATRSERIVDAEEDLYDDVRKRRSALRWLPVCFVGA